MIDIRKALDRISTASAQRRATVAMTARWSVPATRTVLDSSTASVEPTSTWSIWMSTGGWTPARG